MRVLINAATAYMGGALNYITQLTKEISQHKESHRFLILAPPKTYERLEQTLAQSSGLGVSNIELRKVSQQGGGPLKSLGNNLRLVPQVAKEWRADILLSSTGFGTWNSPCPEVLLVRNAAYFCPHYQKNSLRKGYKGGLALYPRRWLSLVSILRATTILFPSDSIREEVKQFLSLKRKKTHVIHYGFDHSWAQQEAETPPIVEKIQQWKEEGYHILLHVSSYAVHKNVEVILEALPLLRQKGMKLKWVTTLSRDKTGDKASYDTFIQRVNELGLQDVLETSGYLRHEQLASLYRSADVFVFPSFTESFGQPLVEAMGTGLPVVASDRPVHRELGGEAFRYFDTFSPTHCASVLEDVLQNPETLERMRELSYLRGQSFSWERYARELVAFLEEECDRGR